MVVVIGLKKRDRLYRPSLIFKGVGYSTPKIRFLLFLDTKEQEVPAGFTAKKIIALSQIYDL